jgi:hypothetical protein
VRQITYTRKDHAAQNVYRNGVELVVLPGATFPDICVGCGKPAWGNTITKEYFALGELWFLLPTVLDLIAFGLRKRYLFDFPFCSTCPPGSFSLRKVRLDDYLGVFTGAAKAFLDSLPVIPPVVEVERNRSWLQRRFRWLYG